jgi:hypothetical protein
MCHIEVFIWICSRPMRAICIANFILLEMISVITFDEE